MTETADLPPRRGANRADAELLGLACPYALDAITTTEEAAIAARLADADEPTRETFTARTRDVRETVALLSAAYSTAPPPALRARLLDAVDDVTQDSPNPADPPGRAKNRRLRWLFVA